MKVFNLLFKADEYICVGNMFETAVQKVNSVTQPYEFFCINPLKGSRKDSNVTAFRNFLFEMDNVPLEDQLKLIKASKVALTSVIYSGGKSYHILISLENDSQIKSIEQYKIAWKDIANYLGKEWGISPKSFDAACQNPSRLSRFPGFIRNTGKEQKQILIGKLWTDETFQKAVPDLSVQSFSKLKIVQLQPRTVEQMERMMPPELNARLKFPKSWARGSAGNYPELLKLILWIIDTTQADPQSIETLLSKKVFPTLLQMGYPEQKLRKPIKDALVVKGLK